MKRLILLLLFVNTFVFVHAQAKVELSELGIFSTHLKGSGKVYFDHPEHFNDILKSKIRVVKKEKVWRVRIYMGTGNNARAIANSVRASFISDYPDIVTNTRYPSPYFKVFVGAFNTRLEAESFRTKLLHKYPDSRVEADVINFGSDTEN